MRDRSPSLHRDNPILMPHFRGKPLFRKSTTLLRNHGSLADICLQIDNRLISMPPLNSFWPTALRRFAFAPGGGCNIYSETSWAHSLCQLSRSISRVVHVTRRLLRRACS